MSVLSESILTAIERCLSIILIFSTSSNTSPHVLREVASAVENGKMIGLFRIESSELSNSLTRFASIKRMASSKLACI